MCCARRFAVLLFILFFYAAPEVSAQDLFVFPSRGQSNEQMQRDRMECHAWARQQTGFDPFQASPGAPPPQAAGGSTAGAVIGGGAVGVETALLLADKGTLSGDALKFLLVNHAEAAEDLYELASRGTKQIVLLEMIDSVGKDIGRSTRWAMMQDVKRAGIEMRVATRALEITASSVRVETDGRIEEIPVDTVVLAAGAQAFNPLQKALEKRRIPVQVVGDAKTPAKAFDAIHQGFAAGRNV